MKFEIKFRNMLKRLCLTNSKVQYTGTLKRVCSNKEFRIILEKERARVERNDHKLSLVLFKRERLNTGTAPLQHTIDVIVHRIRSTDEVGWFDNHRIGVILPDTSIDGAKKFASDVCEIIAATSPPPACEIYTYPSKWLSKDDNNQKHLRIDNKSYNENKVTLRENSSCTELASDGDNTSHNQVNSSIKGVHINTAKGFEPFFVRRLPIWKRFIDIIGSLLAIIIFTPIMIVIAFAIKLIAPGPIFFKQMRIGYRGCPFKMYKFRSMEPDVGDELHATYISKFVNGGIEKNSDGLFKLKDDPRVTPVGRFLRKWSLDELPQLFNVLKGDMSLVGPRPEPCYVGAHYSPWQYSRNMEAKPGLTGQWQVEARGRVSFENMIRMDINYCRSLSFIYDMKLIFCTFKAVLTKNGA